MTLRSRNAQWRCHMQARLVLVNTIIDKHRVLGQKFTPHFDTAEQDAVALHRLAADAQRRFACLRVKTLLQVFLVLRPPDLPLT